MHVLYSFVAVMALVAIATVGVSGLGMETLFAVVIPYAAVGLFLVGFVYRVLR